MSDLTDALDAALCEDLDAIDFTEAPAPVPDAYALDGRMAALARLRRDLAEFDAIAKRRLEALNEAIIQRRAKKAAQAAWLQQSLELSMAGLYADDHRRTSLTLTSGELRSRDLGVEWAWPDDGTPEHKELVAWIKANLPAAFKQPPAPEPTVAKAEAKKLLADYALAPQKAKESQKPAREDGTVVVEGGEIVPALRIVKKPREFLVEPNLGGDA